MIKPHILLKPRVFKDRNRWCALYGPNIQEWIAGFGVSRSEACANFDRAWETYKVYHHALPGETMNQTELIRQLCRIWQGLDESGPVTRRGADARDRLQGLLRKLSPCPECKGRGWVNPDDPENCPSCDTVGFTAPD